MRHFDAFRYPEMTGVRVFSWQIDYRPDGWLPLGVREGWVRWLVIPIGKGCITVGPTQ